MSSDALLSLSRGMSPMNDFDSRLAMELAIELSDLPDILARYDMTPADLRIKLQNPPFRQMVKEFKATWNSDLSVKERIRVKSMALVEDSLLELHTIFHNTEYAVGPRLEAFKNMAKVATVDTPDKEGQAAGDRVQINISIPGVEAPRVYEGSVTVGEEDGREEITYGP